MSPKAEILLIRFCVFACLVSSLGAGWYAYQWWQARQFNQELAALSLQTPLPVSNRSSGLLLMIAQAEKLRLAGKDSEALARLRDVESLTQDRSKPAILALNLQAKFNSANLYLRQAIELMSRGEKAKALPPTELAKALYREVLRQDPGAWDARYNLERALLIIPESVADDEEVLALPPPGERAVTTMRGVSPGLP